MKALRAASIVSSAEYRCGSFFIFSILERNEGMVLLSSARFSFTTHALLSFFGRHHQSRPWLTNITNLASSHTLANAYKDIIHFAVCPNRVRLLSSHERVSRLVIYHGVRDRAAFCSVFSNFRRSSVSLWASSKSNPMQKRRPHPTNCLDHTTQFMSSVSKDVANTVMT